MKVMSVNAGSSSLKFSLFEMDNKELIASGYFERVTLPGSFFNIKFNGEEIHEDIEMPNHNVAVEILLDRLISLGIVNKLEEIGAVGHRLAHGVDKYKSSVVITDEVIKDVESYTELAPLHVPANLLGVYAVKKALPNVPMVGVFDTAFHQTMDEVQYLYPVPYNWYTDYKVRKYGFHGTSHCYISKQIPKLLGKDEYKAIICHLGSGASITAVKNGKCVDTSMGFTPLPGIMMGTRSGDIDPSIIPYIADKENKTANEVVDELNKKSGLLGLSCKSNDFRDIVAGINEGDPKCKLAFDKFVKTIVDYIAMYYVELGGADAICFTAGIGERSDILRKKIAEKLSCLGVKIDKEKNKAYCELKEISSDDSSIKLYVVPTDEELMIALDTYELVNK